MAGRRLDNSRLAKPVWWKSAVPGRFEPSEGEVARGRIPAYHGGMLERFAGPSPQRRCQPTEDRRVHVVAAVLQMLI